MQHPRPVMTVFDGLDTILDKQFEKWMTLVSPRPGWDLDARSPNHDPEWWRRLRETLGKAYRQGADRASRRFEKAQADEFCETLRTKGVIVSHQTIADAGRMSLGNLYRMYSETSTSGESAVNLFRMVLSAYGRVLQPMPTASDPEHGAAELLRYIRYRFIHGDAFCSPWPATTRKGDTDEETASRFYAPDKRWIGSTRPPHPRYLWTLRALVLNRVCIRPQTDIPREQAWKHWMDAARFAEGRSWPAVRNDMNERALVDELRPWVTPFAVGVFVMDPIRLTGDVSRKSRSVNE